MAKYRPVKVKIWNDPDFEDLSPNAKLIFLFLFTNPFCSESGIYKITYKKISDFTNIQIDEVSKIMENELLGDLEDENPDKFCYYDIKHKTIFVTSFFKHNGKGRKDLVHTAVTSELSSSCSSLVQLFTNIYPSLVQDFSRTRDSSLSLSFNKNNNNKYNNIINNINKLIVNKRSKEFVESFMNFVEMRNKIKKPLDLTQAKLVLASIDEFSNSDADKIKILNKSIVNEWKDVFPLNEKNKTSSIEDRLKHFLSEDKIKKIIQFCPDITLGYINKKIEILQKRRPQDPEKFLYSALTMNFGESNFETSIILKKALKSHIFENEFLKIDKSLHKFFYKSSFIQTGKIVYELISKPKSNNNFIQNLIFDNLEIGDNIFEKDYIKLNDDTKSFFKMVKLKDEEIPCYKINSKHIAYIKANHL